jgi:hypothetical protein
MNDWEKHSKSINKKLKKAPKITHVGGVRGIPIDLSEIMGAVRIDPKKFIK